MAENDKLRELPAVHEVLAGISVFAEQFPRALVVTEIRRALDEVRGEIRLGGPAGPSVETRVRRALETLRQPSLQRVINATGVVLHTNLGRAPLGPVQPVAGYSNLEFDLATGRRGKRDVHLGRALDQLLGSPAIAVNNNAAAIFLALNEIASGGEVIVSRGELIEIGDGFRIPEIMARSGAALCEIGTTNRTRIEDYRAAINPKTRLLLRVHPSNFRMSGFTGRPALQELVALGREHHLPVYEDLGSGCLTDLRPFGIEEPLVSESLETGADLVSFSGDKLLGGPQAGILAGKPELISRLRRNPLFRALRLDKMIYQALESTLRHLLLEEYDSIPALAMIRQAAETVRSRAQSLVAQITSLRVAIIDGQSVVGGGATPEQSLPTWLIAIDCADVIAAERRLRSGTPPVIARIENDRLLLDLRTVFAGEEAELRNALQALAS